MSSIARISEELEVHSERTAGVNLSTGERFDGLDVRYRLRGTRRWTKFLVVRDEGQTIEDLEGHVFELAELHRARTIR